MTGRNEGKSRGLDLPPRHHLNLMDCAWSHPFFNGFYLLYLYMNFVATGKPTVI